MQLDISDDKVLSVIEAIPRIETRLDSIDSRLGLMERRLARVERRGSVKDWAKKIGLGAGSTGVLGLLYLLGTWIFGG